MAEIKKLQVDGADIYPVTHESAVYDNEGKSIESKYLSSVAYTQGDDIKIADESGNIIDTSELEAQIEEVDNKVGELSNLQTTDKDNIVDALNEVFQLGNDVKQNLVDALIAKGVQASTSETFDSLIAKLNDIQSSDNPYNIITASSLPDTGEENQLCVITEGTPSSFYFNASSNTTSSDAVTFICVSGSEANYMATSNGITNLYNISYCTHNENVVPVWIYTNGEWVNVCMSTDKLMENGVINTLENNFYNVAFDYSNYWSYYEGTGLYTAAIANNYYSSVTTTNPINFSEFNQVKITARIESDSTYGLALFKSDSALNSLHADETYTTITEYQQLSTTSASYYYDISDWSGEGYLGIVRYNGDAHKIWITDIELVKASGSTGDSGGSEDTTEGTVLFNSSTDNIGFSQALWTTTDSDANSLLNVGIDSYNKAYVGLNATNYSNGDIGAVGLYKTLQNLSVSQLQSFTYCKIKYTMSYNSSSTWETYDAPTFGFTDNLHEDSVTLTVSKTEQEVTHYFSNIQNFNSSADVTIFFTMPLVGGENIRFTITEITLYGDTATS